MVSDNNERSQSYDLLLPPPKVNESEPKDGIESTALYNGYLQSQSYISQCIAPWMLDLSTTVDIGYVPDQVDAFQMFDSNPATLEVPSTILLNQNEPIPWDSTGLVLNSFFHPSPSSDQDLDFEAFMASIGEYEENNINLEDNASDTSLPVTGKRSRGEEDKSTRYPKRRKISSEFTREEHAKLSCRSISQSESQNDHESIDDKGDATHAIREVPRRRKGETFMHPVSI